MLGGLRPLLRAFPLRRSFNLCSPLAGHFPFARDGVTAPLILKRAYNVSHCVPRALSTSLKTVLPLNAAHSTAQSSMTAGLKSHPNSVYMRQTIRLMSTSSQDLPKPSLIQRAKAGMKHYVDGSKLLVYETRISARLLRKVLRGESLIRREYLQLVRTARDMFRLVPFVIIMIVPFLEFALPVLLKLFPNMLPSTFEDKARTSANVQKKLVAKMKVAEFLQDTANAMAKENVHMTRIRHILERARTPGKILREDELVAVCKAMGEQSSLDSLGRAELQLIAQYMELRLLWLPTPLLRRRIRRALAVLREDDEMIRNEGVASLTDFELRAACHARGIYSDAVSVGYLRRELDSWIRLHIVHCIPAPVLILSRAYALTSALSVDEAMQKAVAGTADEMNIDGPMRKLTEVQLQQETIESELAKQRTTSDSGTSEKQHVPKLASVSAKLEKQAKRVKSEARIDHKKT